MAEKLTPDDARRLNAQKSTGPKTEQGKANSSRNATKHGLHATDIVITSPHLQEDQSVYDELVESLFNELKPKGDFQEHLVHKIAQCIWRHRRAINAEAAIVTNQINSESSLAKHRDKVAEKINIPGVPQRTINWLIARAIPDEDKGPNFHRYEWRLESQLTRTYRLLRLVQLTDQTNSLQK